MSVICAWISGVLRSSCILLGGEITHEEHEGHGEFRFVLRTAGRLRSGERGLLARSARQLAEHKIPSASCRRLQAGSLRSPELGRAMTALFRESARCYSPSCDSYYLRLHCSARVAGAQRHKLLTSRPSVSVW